MNQDTVSIFNHAIAAPLLTQEGFSLRSVLPRWSAAVSCCGTLRTSQQTANESVIAEQMSHQDQTTPPPSSPCR